MQAFLKNNRQAPRKVRLVAREVRGKTVRGALDELSVMSQKAAPTLSKLISSAYANAMQKQPNLKAEDVTVRSITVDKGMTIVRFMPRAMGRATPINRECSHIRVELALVSEASMARLAKRVKSTK